MTEAMTDQHNGEAQGADGGSSGVPPYISFKTLLTFLKDLREHDIPNKVDRSVLGRFSGSVGSQLMTALRWLDLVDADMVPTPKLKELVETHETPKWQATLGQVLRDRYKFAFKLGLTTATPAQFADSFRKFGTKDDVLAKSRRFFLQAADSAGIEVNTRLKQRAKPTPKPKAKKRANDGQREPHPKSDRGSNATDTPPPPSEKSDYEFLIGILDPTKMEEEEQKAVWTLIRFLKKQEADD